MTELQRQMNRELQRSYTSTWVSRRQRNDNIRAQKPYFRRLLLHTQRHRKPASLTIMNVIALWLGAGTLPTRVSTTTRHTRNSIAALVSSALTLLVRCFFGANETVISPITTAIAAPTRTPKAHAENLTHSQGCGCLPPRESKNRNPQKRKKRNVT